MKYYSAAALLFIYSAMASAADIKFCFTVYGDYTDSEYPADGDPPQRLKNNVAEDYWKDGEAQQLYRGAVAQVRLNSSSGTLLFSGNLGDGLGTGDPGVACTNVISLSNVNQTYWWRVDSTLAVNGNTIIGRRADTDGTCYRSSVTTISSGGGTYTIPLSGSSEECKYVFRATSAGAFSLYRHNGGNSSKTFIMRAGSGASGNFTSGLVSNLTVGGATRKFTSSHEFGHALIFARNSSFNNSDCSFNSTLCPGSGTGQTSHAMASLEHQSCALTEAFARFVAADTYNNHAQIDCAYNYANPYYPTVPDLGQQVVDCDGTSAFGDQSKIKPPEAQPSFLLYPIRTMEQIFPPNFQTPGCTTSMSGKGTEIDWLRALWYMHTPSSSSAGFTEIVDWLVTSGIGTQTCYNQLDSRANTIGGIVNTKWDTAKTTHGVDH